jgi:L-alanine-DL-glutamate epimerase-like enolase superfamily enzyme
MRKIAAITTTIFALPLVGDLQWGKASRLAEARHVLVAVTLDDGSRGVAEAPPRPTIYGETEYTITAVIDRALAPALVGQPVTRVEAFLGALKNNPTAKGALDMALHDALAQSRGVSLFTHLCELQRQQAGGAGAVAEDGPLPTDPPGLRVSYILGIGDRDTVLAEAERVVAAGVRVLKVKVGREWDEDLARIADLQRMLGSAVQLYADANECLDPATAGRQLDHLRAQGLLYCEEPLPVELIRARAALRAGGHLPLIADDSAFTARDLLRELDLDTFDILNIKTPRTGYTESLRMLALARAAGKGIMVGSQAGTGIGVARAAIFAALAGIDHPSELSFFLKLRQDIVDRPLPLRDGRLALADVLALRIDPQALAAASV